MTEQSKILPFGRSYWVVPNRLLAGFTLGSRSKEKSILKLTGLSRVGVSHIINLIEEDEFTTDGIEVVQYEDNLEEFNKTTDSPLTYERLSIVDMNVPTKEHMKLILDSIDTKNTEGKSVFIHCHGGFGRTGTSVGCYLKRHGLATNDNVFETINYLRRTEEEAHRISPQREIQHKFILNWEKNE